MQCIQHTVKNKTTSKTITWKQKFIEKQTLRNKKSIKKQKFSFRKQNENETNQTIRNKKEVSRNQKQSTNE